MLVLMFVSGLYACGEKAPEIRPVYGPFSLVDGKLSLEGVSMGDDPEEAKNVVEGRNLGRMESHLSSEERAFEVFMDTEKESGGISYNVLSYSAGLKDNVVNVISAGFQHDDVDDSLLNDPEKLRKTIDDFFAPYKSAASEMENVLITKLPTIEYFVDENGNREDTVFSYGENEIYTMVFVDGESIKVSSRKEAANMEGATILEINFYAQSLTAAAVDYYLNDDGQTYMGELSVFVTVMPAEMLP